MGIKTVFDSRDVLLHIIEISSALISLASMVRTHGQPDRSSFIEHDAIETTVAENNNIDDSFISDNCLSVGEIVKIWLI